MTLRRTPKEILNKIESLGDDMFDFRPGDLLAALPFKDAKPHLNKGVGPKKWAKAQTTDPLKEARDYLDFAWEKANGCRGLSASRSLNHLEAWLWLAGLDDVDFSDYTHYGKLWLVAATTALLGPDEWKKLDDGVWRNYEGYGDDPNDIEKMNVPIQEMEILGCKWADKLRELNK